MHAPCLMTCCRSVTASFLSFLFPPTCLACRSLLSNVAEVLCFSCAQSLRRVDPEDAVYQQTLAALAANGSIDQLRAPFYFEKAGALQELLHQLKYNGMTRVGRLVGAEIAKTLDGLALSEDALIVPVPLHRTKFRERGYNQADYVGRGIAGALGLRVLSRAVHRTVYTKSQTKLDSVQRAKNVEGVFKLANGAEDLLRGKTILLVDDVITTGATIRSCALALREANPASIVACAVALAQ